MPNTNIQSLNYNDSQSSLIDKINNNFDEVVESHGGTKGNVGPTGPQGAIGEAGNRGPTGISGPRGNRWFISSTGPAGNFSQEGDYWIDSISSDIYQLDSTGWIYTGHNLKSVDNLFSAISSSYYSGPSFSGGTASAIYMDQIVPKNYLFILSDVTPESGVLNELLSKFVVSTNTSVNDAPLLEFSRSDIEDGTLSDYSMHPVFYWNSNIPTDNTLGLRVPGSSFFMGASGGFEFSFSSFNASSQKDLNIDYGTDSSSGIYSTGGYNISASDEYNVISSNLNISGGSGSFSYPLNSVATLASSQTHTYIEPGGTQGLKSTRTGDTYATLYPDVYHISLGNNSGREFWLSTKGKFRTKKTRAGISYPTNSPGPTATAPGGTVINWYMITRTGTSTTPYRSAILESGNTIIINPAVRAGTLVGLGIWNGDDNGWCAATGGLEPGQSIDISVYNSSDAGPTASVGGFAYIGIGNGATSAVKITLPFLAKCIDLTIARGITGASGGTVNSNTVYYRAYSPWGGYFPGSTGGAGGSFNF